VSGFTKPDRLSCDGPKEKQIGYGFNVLLHPPTGLPECYHLRQRPVGKAPAGAPPKLIACEKCTMHPLVDMAQIPTVSLDAYLSGSKPRTVNLNSPKNKKLLANVA
jgi:hypothetical protein